MVNGCRNQPRKGGRIRRKRGIYKSSMKKETNEKELVVN